jgi:hypothetical protein
MIHLAWRIICTAIEAVTSNVISLSKSNFSSSSQKQLLYIVTFLSSNDSVTSAYIPSSYSRGLQILLNNK